MSDHGISIGEGWRLWRRFTVRGCGFPSGALARLALADTIGQIDTLIELDDQLQAGRTAANVALAVAARENALPPAWQSRTKTLDRLLAGRDIPLDGLPPALAEALAALVQAIARGRELRATLPATFAREQAQSYANLAALARDDRFREAVTWQNRDAAARLFTGLDAHPELPRRYALLVASYLQRYCAKADTIGFFGPISWGRFAADEPTAQRAGASLLARRHLYFELWAIDTLAQRIATLPGVRPWLAPRRVPTVRVAALALDPVAARMLGDCDGVQPARELAARWRAAFPAELPDDAAVERALADLVARGLVHWTLEVPVGDSYPERSLRRAIEAIGDPALRAAALAPLDELEQKRAAVARAAGDSAALAAALDDANAAFTRLTGAEATRHGGKTYAARTILYEETERDHELVLGAELLGQLGPPLRLLLWSARWFMHTVVARFEDLFRDILARHGPELDYLRFWEQVSPHVAGGSAVQTGQRSALVQDVEAELQRRWAELFALAPEQRRRDLTTAELVERVRAAFPAPHGGIELFRHHCPDIAVVADDLAALQRGDCTFVLSELHVGGHTFTRPLYFEQCRFADELIAARRADLPSPELFPILKKDMHLGVSPTTTKDIDRHYETADARSPLPRDRVYAVGELTVRDVGGRAMVCAPDGRRFAAADFLGFYIVRAAIQSFSVVPPLPHSPRITIDRLVVARETWRLTRDALAFVDVADDLERLVAARRWMRALGLPRLVFVKVAEEKKPVYVDLASTLYLDLLRRLVRNTKGTVVISEMLPTLDHSWLTDGDGRRYVCELRMAAVDPELGPSSTGG